jgi:hypothetical protein
MTNLKDGPRHRVERVFPINGFGVNVYVISSFLDKTATFLNGNDTIRHVNTACYLLYLMVSDAC